MLLFHCTQAATAALTTTRQGIVQSCLGTEMPSDSAWVWQLHAVKLARKLVFVAMQHETRFAMVFWGLKWGDGETLATLFAERLATHLLRLAKGNGAVDPDTALMMIDQLMHTLHAIGFQARSDRSVQTHLNEVVQLCRYAVAEFGGLPDNGAAATGFDAQVNDTLRSIRGAPYFQPEEALLLHCLEVHAGFDSSRLQQVKDAFKAAYLYPPLAAQGR